MGATLAVPITAVTLRPAGLQPPSCVLLWSSDVKSCGRQGRGRLTERGTGLAGRRIALVAGVLGLCLTGCGEGGTLPSGVPSSLPSLTIPTRSPQPEQPTPEPPPASPTRSPIPPANPTTNPPNPTTARPPLATTTEAATPTPTPTPPPTTPEATPAPTPEATPTSTPAPAVAAEPSDSDSAWLWWLLGLLAAGAAAAFVVWLVRTSGARKNWEARLAGAVGESTWLAHQLLPAVLGVESPAARRNMWIASRPRVETLERSLGELSGSAPPDRLGGVDRVRAAVTDLSAAMDAYSAPGIPDDREALGAARLAQRQLEEALRALQPPAAQGDLG